MSNTTFDLLDLFEEPLYFRDVEDHDACSGEGCDACGRKGKVLGQRYDALRASMLGPEMAAAYHHLEAQRRSAMLMLNGKATPEQSTKASQDLKNIVDDLIRLLVPELPAERRRALPFGYKAKFINWWRDQHPQQEQADQGEARGQRVIRGRRSRASSGSGTIPSGSSAGRAGSGKRSKSTSQPSKPSSSTST